MLYAILSSVLVFVMLLLLWPVRRNAKLCSVLALLMVAGSSGLYAWLGSPDMINLLAAHQTKIERITSTITTSQEAITSNPNDLEAWLTIGQGFAEMRQWQPAANAFKQAVILSKANPDIIMAYARSLIFAADGTVTKDAKQSLDMVILQKPSHSEARYYSAVYILQQGEAEKAMAAMKSLYESLDENDPVKAMINEQIGR